MSDRGADRVSLPRGGSAGAGNRPGRASAVTRIVRAALHCLPAFIGLLALGTAPPSFANGPVEPPATADPASASVEFTTEQPDPVVIDPLDKNVTIDLTLELSGQIDGTIELDVTDLIGATDPSDFLAGELSDSVLSVSDLPAVVTLTLSGLLRIGEYSATVKASQPDGTELGALTLKVVRRSIAFFPEIEGALVTGERIEFRPRTPNEASFGFVVRNPADGAVRCIRIPAVATTSGSTLPLTFDFNGDPPNAYCGNDAPAGDGAAQADFAPGQAREVTATIGAPFAVGTHTASIKMVDPVSPLAEKTFSLSVVHQPTPFNPALSGELVDEGKIAFQPEKSDDDAFRFVVENPADGDFRCIQILPVAATANAGLDLKFQFDGNPSSDWCASGESAGSGAVQADFAPGQSRDVTATITGGPALDPRKAQIVLVDPTVADARASFALTVDPTFGAWRPTWEMLYSFAAVFVGSLISVFLNHAAPLALDRMRWRRQLDRALRPMRDLQDDRLRLRLENERHEIDLKQRDMALGTPKIERTSVQESIDALVEKVKLAKRIERFREHCRRSSKLPPLLLSEVYDQLRAAEWQLTNGRVDEATAAVNAAEATEPTAENTKEVNAQLAQGFDRIKKLNPTALGQLQVDFDALKAKKAALEKGRVPAAETLPLNVGLLKLSLLVEHFDDRIAKSETLLESLTNEGESSDDCKLRLRTELMSRLERSGTEALEAASAMVRDMETGYLPNQIVGRLEGAGRIECKPRNPKCGQLTVFTLSLGNPLDSATAAQDLDYDWSVREETLTSVGKRCSITFDKEGTYVIEVQARGPGGNVALLDDQVKVRASSAPSFFRRLMTMQTIVFFATVCLAAVLAWTMHFGAFEIKSFGDLFVPFLIGISIEQFREQITSGQIEPSTVIRST